MTTPGTPSGWQADRLLPGYLARTLPADRPPPVPATARAVAAGGAAVLTLVRPTDEPVAPRGVVVRLHGYNDYFFATHLADAFATAGWAFLALDARRAGRSLRPGEAPHYQGDLREQATDLTRAVAEARRAWPGLPVVVHAHSTGGLVAALWAHAHRERGGADAVVLDSPFLAARRARLRSVQDGAVRALGRRAPLQVVAQAPSPYAARLARRWDFDQSLKRPQGVPVRAGWLAAMRAGQRRVARGLAIDVPVLVARSARSGVDRGADGPQLDGPQLDGPEPDAADTVLDVTTIAELAPRLGPRVSELVVDGGVHDLALSLDAPRRRYLDGVLAFLDGVHVVPADARRPPRPDRDGRRDGDGVRRRG